MPTATHLRHCMKWFTNIYVVHRALFVFLLHSGTCPWNMYQEKHERSLSLPWWRLWLSQLAECTLPSMGQGLSLKNLKFLLQRCTWQTNPPNSQKFKCLTELWSRMSSTEDPITLSSVANRKVLLLYIYTLRMEECGFLFFSPQTQLEFLPIQPSF